MSKKIPIYYSLPAILFSTFLVAIVVLAWTEPTAVPPAGNVPAPINVGSTDQWKDARLGVGTNTAAIYWLTDVGNSLYFQSQDNTTVPPTITTKMVIGQNGKVGIGTTSPAYKLTIQDTSIGGIGIDVSKTTSVYDGMQVGGRFRTDGGVMNYGVIGIASSPAWGGMNYGGYFSATGGIESYGLVVANGGLRLIPTSTPTAANGVIYYDSGTNKFRCYQNGAWADCIGGGAGGGIGGGGNDNYIPRWNGATNLEDSVIYQTDAGNVGIGTTPGYKLDVNGDINLPTTGFLRIAGSAGLSGQVLARTATGMAWQAAAGGGVIWPLLSTIDGTAAAPAYSWSADTNMGFYRGGADNLRLVTNGLDRITIKSDGNVGIGTTSPGVKLEVAGQVKITGGSPGAGKVLTSSDASGLASWQPPPPSNCTRISYHALSGTDDWYAVNIPSVCQNGICLYYFMLNNNTLIPPSPWIGMRMLWQYDFPDASAGYTVGMMGFEDSDARNIRNGDTNTDKTIFQIGTAPVLFKVVEDKWVSGAYIEYSRSQFSVYTRNNYYSQLYVCSIGSSNFLGL